MKNKRKSSRKPEGRRKEIKGKKDDDEERKEGMEVKQVVKK